MNTRAISGLRPPRWTKPWKVVAIAMAALGFVNGYVGIAGAPFCGSMGQCLQRVVDGGPPWFYPAAFIPASLVAAAFAAVVYVLFLFVSGIRAALNRQRAGARTGTSTQGGSSARLGAMRGIRPRPLLVAVVAGVAWAVFSVGPSQLVTDLDLLIPRDAITAPLPVCSAGYGLTPSGTCASTAFPMSTLCEQIGTCTPAPVIAAPRPTLICGDLLGASVLPSFEETLEADQMCHDRSGGTVGPLIDDLLDGAKAWLLAFLAVGSALLIWPRLQKAGSPTA